MKVLYRTALILAAVLLWQIIPLNTCLAQHLRDIDMSTENMPTESQERSAGGLSTGSHVTLREAEKIISLHNKIRAEVGVGPLRWSDKLAGYAQQWVDHLVNNRCGMEHRPSCGKWRQKYGENLFMGTAGYYGTSDAVMAWAKEKDRYQGGALQSSNWAGAGHYTQIVWRDTRQIGCATGVCRKNLIVVCNYFPPGNFLGRKPY